MKTRQHNPKDLLFSLTKKDFTLTCFSGTGAGGQHRNKHQNCVRLKHNETGVIVTGQSHKSFEQNKKEAINNLWNNAKFNVWFNLKVRKSMDELDGRESIEEKVEGMMSPENIKIEGKNETGQWSEDAWPANIKVEANSQPETDPDKWPNNVSPK